MNTSKSMEVLQGQDESPSQFYEFLLVAMWSLLLVHHFDPEAAKTRRIINAAFVSQALGDIRKSYKSLRGLLVWMPASQLLGVAPKFCVNWDQEDKWEADRNMKRKVDLFAVALAEQWGGLWWAGHGRGRGNPCGWHSALVEQPHPREELKQDQCACCCREGRWINECLQWPTPSQKAPQTRCRGRAIKGKHWPAQGRSGFLWTL
jgi:hypothetical protein